MKVAIPNFEKRGGVCVAIAQDYRTGEILMQGYTDRAGYLETLRTGEAVYFSTSRKKRWKKGETSGDVQIVHDVLIDCDGDSIIYRIEQRGEGACHTRARTCFYRDFAGRYRLPVQDGPGEQLAYEEAEVAKNLAAPPFPSEH
jgi:phosphoribosyl-AMP cyclohydrolase